MNEDLRALMDRHVGTRMWPAPLSSYKPLLLEACARKTVLEVGAGCKPLFSAAELADQAIDYYANDISELELRRMPEPHPFRIFDACGDLPIDWSGKFDVVFAHMVQEHVPDGHRFYRNMWQLLRPGGFILSLHPTLYSLPFVVNRLVPERASSRILGWVQPKRAAANRTAKFPATYALSRVSPRVRRQIGTAGFHTVVQLAFYGHPYYRRLPPLERLHTKASSVARRHEWAWLSSYSYTVAFK